MKLMKTIGKSIDIFGDSFSCLCCKFNTDNTWLDILEKEYGFVLNNNSLHGTGAQWCIEKLMSIENNSDFLLFFLPDMNRLSLDYLPEHNASTGSMIYGVMNNHENKKLKFPEKVSNQILNQKERIYNDYESFYTTGLYRILEVLFTSFIFTKSKKYKKILIWPSSGLGYPFRYYNGTLEIPSNVHIVSRCLNLISHLEKNKNSNSEFIFHGEDKRNNHLSQINHQILAKQIHKFFVEDQMPNVSEFKREII